MANEFETGISLVGENLQEEVQQTPDNVPMGKFGVIDIAQRIYFDVEIKNITDWTKQDFDKLVDFAEKGNLHAQAELGRMYEDGVYVNPDIDEAVKWYEKAVAMSQPLAMSRLGICCLNGNGVMIDKKRALELLQKGVEAEVKDAQLQMGILLEEGELVEQDLQEAFNLYCEAIWQPDRGEAKISAGAASRLGYMYYEGKGVDRDIVQALSYWFSCLDMKYGNEFAREAELYNQILYKDLDAEY